ncbi:MAG: ornithine carbamoyltransferase [Oscillospiraceae bacterium]|jgi:ornithine carbamoyltransferase|nr:ornithine carbamoyltransferase [Oscillospiraceae bacterium]
MFDKKDFLLLMDYSPEEIAALLDLAADLKAKKRARAPHALLQGKTLGMIFEKSSTRTRVSFEVGMADLGGHALLLSPSDMQLGRGESIEDTARVLSRYLDGIMIRTFEQDRVEKLARWSAIPVINGLTDFAHPCQVMADLLTVRERVGRLEGLTLCYVGDGFNVANSLIAGGIKAGMRVRMACPSGYEPDAGIMAWARANGDFLCTPDVMAAAAGADVLYTDVWASMGQEEEAAARGKAFAGYQINQPVVDIAAPGAMVLHDLPAHKGEEITFEVFEAHAQEIFDQAENRLHAQKAVMVKLMQNAECRMQK